MKNTVKAALILMAILTAIYVSAVVYANVNANVNANDDYYIHPYLTSEYVDTPPTEWYTPEELGIVEVWELGNRAVQIVVDRRKEPFPFGPLGTDDQLTVFLYKDEFYTVSHLWVTFAIGRGSLPPWQIPIGGVLGVGWVFTGILFLKWRQERVKDKVLIPIVLALYIGLWIFTGTAAGAVTPIWQRTVSLVTTPFGIILLIAGGITIAVMVIKERRRQ